MTKKKTIGMGLAILGIVFLIYNMLVFLILTPQTPVFWISYGFMVLAFGLQVLGMYMSFKDFDVQAIFFGIPLKVRGRATFSTAFMVGRRLKD